MPLDRVGRLVQVRLGHQIRVDVVRLDGRVLVGAGHPVEVELAVPVMVPERPPEPSRLDEDLQPDRALELGVPGRLDVAHSGRRDVGVDVERSGAGRPVRRALLAADRPPRERGTLEPEVGRPLPGQVQGRVPPVHDVARGVRLRVREHRQHEQLGVPEDVPVVSGPGQPLGRDRPALAPRARLQDVEQREPHRLLDLRVAVDLDVGRPPERVEVLALRVDQPVPAGQPGPGDRAVDLVADRLQRPSAGPPVRDVLDDLQRLPGAELAGDARSGPSPARR